MSFKGTFYSLTLMFSSQKFLTLANIVINQLFPGKIIFFTIFGIQLFAICPPLSLCTYFRLKQKWIFITINALDITDLLQYWLMVEIFDWKALPSVVK